MEPATHNDIWDNFLDYKPKLAKKIQRITDHPTSQELIHNLKYAAAMCRAHYRRKSEPLPGHTDAYAMAVYWKKHYNTPLGAGTVEKALPSFQIACE